jgi:cytoskeletal protein CcmA (bactofilin family)
MAASTSTGRIAPNVAIASATLPERRRQEAPPRRVERTGDIVIGSGVQVRGSIGRCASITVEGDLQSESIHCDVLNIAAGGHLTGAATAAKAEIRGTLHGRLIAEIVSVHNSGQIEGDLEYGELEIERGAKISGKLQSRSN